ncbi:MAG: cysteine peptidase family C39 domain-containing protein [Myxococcota bacterium]|nr:cysteine peptidase family C39 domain-containing protein [Myxococcota bacterium]
MTTAPRARLLAILVLGLLALTGGCRLSYTGGARPVDQSSLDASWLRAAQTPVVRQRSQSDCGLAALAMVAGAWGRTWTLDELSRELTPTAKGVKLGALRDLARQRGLDAYAISGTHEDLRKELGKGRPVLLGLLLPYESDRALNHYEVAIAMDPRDGSVITLDPSSGKHMRRTRQVLEAEWKPGGYPTLVVVGERAVARGDAVTRHASR